MIGILVITHGKLAAELVAATRMIVGGFDNVEAISLGWNDDVAQAREAIRSALKELDKGSGVLILTDMFGGTPTNLSLTFLEKDKTEIVTGVNLPMLIKLAGLKDGKLAEVAERISQQGQKSIYVASAAFAKQAQP